MEQKSGDFNREVQPRTIEELEKMLIIVDQGIIRVDRDGKGIPQSELDQLIAKKIRITNEIARLQGGRSSDDLSPSAEDLLGSKK
jgi:predicted phage gp36 major capsid-like protein